MTREHVINIGVNVDDDEIKNAVIDACSKDLAGKIAKGVCGRGRYCSDTEEKILGDMVSDHINDFLESHKDEIINHTCELLADKLSRTKKMKEAMAKITAEYADSPTMRGSAV